MTVTEPATTGGHRERPCFCGQCLPLTILDLTSEAATTYRDPATRRPADDLATEIVTQIPAAQQITVLRYLLQNGYLHQRARFGYLNAGYVRAFVRGGDERALRWLLSNEITYVPQDLVSQWQNGTLS